MKLSVKRKWYIIENVNSPNRHRRKSTTFHLIHVRIPPLDDSTNDQQNIIQWQTTDGPLMLRKSDTVGKYNRNTFEQFSESNNDNKI